MGNRKEYPNLEDDESLINSVNDVDFSARYNYADYMRFAFDERLEIIKGKLFRMSPAPARLHQQVLGRIYNPIYNFLAFHPCEVYTAPFDVRLATKDQNDQEIFNVVQPDIVVVCDSNKLDKRGCIGSPDLVIEILSPGNNSKELITKYELYEEALVREYWLIDPHKKTFLCYHLNESNKFSPSDISSTLCTEILPGFALSSADVFPD